MLMKLNLKKRMLLPICSIVATAFCLTIFGVAIQASRSVKMEAIEKNRELAHRFSAEVANEINTALNASRTLGDVFTAIKNSTSIPDRDVMNAMLRQVLNENPNFFAVWSVWDPDALNARDSEFSGAPGHDETGRFIPNWHRAGGNVALEPLVEYEALYEASKSWGKEAVLDPYEIPVGGKAVLMTTVLSLIKYEEAVVGAVGVDFTLDTLREMVRVIQPYETGNAALIANNGTYAAHPDENRVGEDIGETALWRSAKDAVRTGKTFLASEHSEYLGTEVTRILVPIRLGETGTPWSFLVNIPMDKVMESAREIRNTALLIGVVSLGVLILIVYFISSGIAGPLERIASGVDLASDQMFSAAGEMSATSQTLAEDASQQAASVEETSASLEEISSMIKQNAGNARNADQLMDEANTEVKRAEASFESLSRSMGEITEASHQTSDIVKTIDEIAFQTNLLALNAAVEAARAGEAGAGFAVVADEVGNLALRATQAARNTTELLQGTVQKIDQGTHLLTETGHAFKRMAESSSGIGNLISEIASASDDQARGIDQIDKAMSEMDRVVQQIAASSEENAGTSEEMNGQAEQLKGYVSELMRLVRGRSVVIDR